MLKRESPTPLDSRIHLYSDMWRHFDAGLHIFMHTYIYQPLVGSSPTALGRRERETDKRACFNIASLNLFSSALFLLGFFYITVGLFFRLLPYFAAIYQQWGACLKKAYCSASTSQQLKFKRSTKIFFKLRYMVFELLKRQRVLLVHHCMPVL